MVTSGAEVVISYDPKTGKELWRANGTGGRPICQSGRRRWAGVSLGSFGKRAMAIKLGGEGDLTASPGVAVSEGGRLCAVAQ